MYIYMYFKYLKSTKRPFCSLVFFRTVLISKEYTGIASLLRIQQVPFEQLACLFLEKRNLTCRVKWYQMPFLLVDPGISDIQRELSIIHVDVVVCCDACFDYPQYNTTLTSQGRKKSCLLCGCFSLFRTCVSNCAGLCACENPRRYIATEGHAQDIRQHFYTYICIQYACTHTNIRLYTYKFMYTCIYINIYVCICVTFLLSPYIYIYLPIYIYIWVYI